MVIQEPGRRERKKAATRQALSDAALRLFAERGYDKVTLAEVAAEADTAIATVFAHFPAGKDALIFDDGSARRADLEAAVRERPEGTSILDAVHGYLARRGPFIEGMSAEQRTKADLIINTPALRAYARTLWIGCQDSLVQAVADESGREPGDPAVRTLARYVLELPDLIGADDDPRASLDAAFAHLRLGWPDL
ncbi:TetR family transcriptional regulator [Streptomyces sp. NPDC047043]|uniref:TetR/AcrR family transcriptional regulator n=1 Tax=Streptomyces sp. NPDC047043 TaxID=3154497 RepID=UPI0033D26215